MSESVPTYPFGDAHLNRSRPNVMAHEGLFPEQKSRKVSPVDACGMGHPEANTLLSAAGCGQASGSLDWRPFDECEDVRIDHVCMSGHHAVWIARVNLERTMLEQLGLQQ